MVSEEEAWRTYPRGEYYTIRPMLPELCGTPAEGDALMKEYSSGDNLLSLEQTRQLLERHDLLYSAELKEDGELLR